VVKNTTCLFAKSRAETAAFTVAHFTVAAVMCMYAYTFIYTLVWVYTHMPSCMRILFICTVQSLYYMRVYHRCFLTPACMCMGGLEVGLFPVCSLRFRQKLGDTEVAERGRSVLVMRTRCTSAGLTPHQRGWMDAGWTVHTCTHTHIHAHIYIRMNMHAYVQIQNLSNNASACQAIS